MVFPIQALLIHGLTRTSGSDLLPILLPLAHLLLLPFLFRNLSFWGIRLVLLGLLLNLSVMLANGGLMPAEARAVEAVGRTKISELRPGDHIPGSKDKLAVREDVHLRELSDTLIVPIPSYTKAISIGDVFVFTGVLVAGFELARRKYAQ